MGDGSDLKEEYTIFTNYDCVKSFLDSSQELLQAQDRCQQDIFNLSCAVHLYNTAFD